MPYNLGDIFIGNFPRSQSFGNKLLLKDANGNVVDVYAQFGLLGHNGADWALPSMTPVLSGANGWVSEIAEDPSGYGRYLKVVHDGFFTLYAHLNNIAVKAGDRVIAGQLIAYSNNSGNSTGPHLHFGVAPCDAGGKKTESDNGYSGYIDPLSTKCVWTIKGLKEPVVSTQPYNKPEIETLREEANINWNAVLEITSFMGLQADPLNKKATVEKAKSIIEGYNQEIAQLKNNLEELKKNYETSQSSVVACKDQMAKINQEDANYAQKALDSEKLANKYKGYIDAIAGEAGVDMPVTVDQLIENILQKISELKKPIPTPPPAIDNPIPSDNTNNMDRLKGIIKDIIELFIKSK